MRKGTAERLIKPAFLLALASLTACTGGEVKDTSGTYTIAQLLKGINK